VLIWISLRSLRVAPVAFVVKMSDRSVMFANPKGFLTVAKKKTKKKPKTTLVSKHLRLPSELVEAIQGRADVERRGFQNQLIHDLETGPYSGRTR